MSEAIEPKITEAAPPLAPGTAGYDAIHRALLTGLLGNVGYKSDQNEYTGARGTKFNIFPGSGLFRKGPRWVVAAEVVETTRLYARTCARIQPEWIERLAGHLVKRAYAEPHWQEATAHVAAYEKVTLYGLTLVEKRLVHYGPIEPKIAREMFILHALVEGQFRTDAPFFRHNRRLVEEVERLEAKARRRDLLADPQARYSFYDRRVPEGVYNGPLFEKWRKEAERENPRALFMALADLLRPGAAGSGEGFPDSLSLDGMTLPLEYRLDPGGPDDGVTVTLPLAALNQLPDEPFEWLVPGLLKEKIAELIRALPKTLRVNFVPAPDHADAAHRALTAGDGSLLDGLALYLGKRSGLPVARQDFQADSLAPHLKMNCRVLDETGKEVAAGRDLAEIRRRLGVQAKRTFAALPAGGEFHRDGLTSWDFGDLPERVDVRRHGMTLSGYPSLADAGATVSLRLLDSPEAMRQSMRAGLRRLFTLQTRDEVRYLERNLPGVESMALNYATLGSSRELKQDLIDAAADRAFFGEPYEVQPESVRTRAAFVARAEQGWRRMLPVARRVCAAVGQALALYQEASRALAASFAPALHPAVRDMQQQLARLVHKKFIRATPPPWLPHLPRFLQAILTRLRKLTSAGLARDSQHAAVVGPLQRAYLDRLEKHRKTGTSDPELELYGWMLEELRVSLFAQELKTSIPVSPKRLEAQWGKVRASS